MLNNPQVKNMTFKHFDLYYTVLKNRNEKAIVNIEYADSKKNILKLRVLSHLIIILEETMMMQGKVEKDEISDK